MFRSGWPWLVLVACACADSTYDGGAAPDAASAHLVSLTSEVSLFVPDSFDTEPALGGVQVCVDGADPQSCVSSAEDGTFTLGGLPPEAEVVLVYTKDGFIPVLQPLVTPRWPTRFDAIGHVRLATEEDDARRREGLNAELRRLGQPEVQHDLEGRSQVLFGALENGIVQVPGYRATLVPASGDGPFFMQGSEATLVPMPREGELSAFGQYLNVEPGDYELHFTRSGGHCVWAPGALTGWRAQSGRPNASRIVARPGYDTWWTALQCPADAQDAGAADAASASNASDADAGS